MNNYNLPRGVDLIVEFVIPRASVKAKQWLWVVLMMAFLGLAVFGSIAVPLIGTKLLWRYTGVEKNR